MQAKGAATAQESDGSGCAGALPRDSRARANPPAQADSSGGRSLRNRIPRWTRVAALVVLLFVAVCYGSYRADRARLRAVANELTADVVSPSGRVLTLLDWVYHNGGFTSNDSYFLFRRLGATPVKVLEGGGDCADKSRLLSALLREVGVPSTMVMCFDVASGKPTHTVVEARIGPRYYMVVDPVYDLYFPRGDSTGFHGLLDLRGDSKILPKRLDELIAVRGRSPILAYNRALGVYDRASSINWGKNRLTRLTHGLLISMWGDDVYRLRRPLVLEEPKLAVASGGLVVCGVVLLFGVAARRRSRRVADFPAPDNECSAESDSSRTAEHALVM